MAGIIAGGGKIGDRCFNIAAQSISKTIPAGKYILTYWAKGSVSVAGVIPKALNETPADENGWRLCEKSFDLSRASTILIEGTPGSLIDEVRWFPADAQMTTYTYDPLVGMRWQNDPNNITTECRYDKFGRLDAIIDHEGNVMKKYTYHYTGK